jgi:hypothetical protein
LAGLSLQHSLFWVIAAGCSVAASVAFGSAILAGSDLRGPAQQEPDMVNLLPFENTTHSQIHMNVHCDKSISWVLPCYR